MIVIHINHTTQQYIADNYSNGVVPPLEYGSEDTYYLVLEDKPNVIVGVEDLCDVYNWNENDTTINVIKRDDGTIWESP
jgi:hypothetical protein